MGYEMDNATALRRRTYGNVARLAAAQALAGANATVIVATGGIVGTTLAPDPSLSTLSITTYVVGMAVGTLPAGAIARRYGRRAAFVTGAVCGTLTGLLAALALYAGSFALFCFATGLGGLYASVVQSFRFAVADGVDPAFRPRALSYVMAGGVFAGVLGPQLVTWTMDLSPLLFFYSYLAQAVVAVLAGIILAGVDLPRPRPQDAVATRPLAAVVCRPPFMVAALCGVVSYGMMNLVMTSAPLAMHLCGLPIADSNFALEWHVVAMYGPSFFTGSLITRFGAPRVVSAGMALLAVAGVVGLSGLSSWHFAATLVLLGLGWNFAFVGASAMVLATHRPEERTRVQSFNDFLVFGIMAVGSFSSGQLLSRFGWSAVCEVVFPFVAIALAALLATARRTRPLAVP